MKQLYVYLNNCNPYNSIYQQTKLLIERLESIYGINILVLSRKDLTQHLNKEDRLILFPYESMKTELLSPLFRFQNVVFIYHNITPARFFWRTEPLVAIRSIAGRIQLRYLKYRTNKWLAVSKYNKQELEKMGFQNVVLCSNLIKRSVSSGEKTLEPSLLYVGRIVQNKRCMELLNIAKNIAERTDQPISLYIVGSGKQGTTYLNEFNNWIKSHVSDKLKIYWLNGLSEEELSELYHHCWLYITLSQHEGFGLPVCESINNGTPAIYTKCGGQEEVLNSIGLTEEKDMVEKAFNLLSNPEELNDLYIQQKQLIEKITIPNYDDEIKQVFSELL